MTDLNGKRHVIATAAYNEERYIEGLIESVVAQALRPRREVIVSDGSTDRTDEIVKKYAGGHKSIQLHRITDDHPRTFGSQAHAINAGFARLRDLDFDFVGNSDADIMLNPTYFSALLRKFDADPALGLAGGGIWEQKNGQFLPRTMNSTCSVAHALQLFRRGC
jgi:cellulose synthase/poly-beta-1,6-N-acetylglucosamine synthase-like glycosyltransferase